MTPSVKHLRYALSLFIENGQGRRLSRWLKNRESRECNREWRYWGREHQQLPPEGDDWRTWLILGGRGAGKTRAGAEWVKARALDLWPATGGRSERIAIVAPTFDEARLVMIEGKSGLLAVHADDERPKYEPSKRQLTWPNGSIAQIFSADEPESLRGPQFDAAWCDELAKWRYGEEAFSMLAFALRLGDNPRVVVTTTPRPTPLLKRLIADATTAVTHTKTADNRAHLAKNFWRDVQTRYGGTRLGRQELDGELIDDDPDALFRRDLIEAQRIARVPELVRIVVAVDPPASHGKKANACGIVCAGLGEDGRIYVLDDCSVNGARPAQWAGAAVALYHARHADRVVAEVNQGGAMVEAVLRETDQEVSFRAVYASRGKKARAEPVAALYEQGRVSHVGSFPELEDEMCTAIGQGAKSPDRLDALVWAVSDLILRRGLGPRVRMV
ncbi:MAG: DNA-packaging protein [Rhizobiales bacterium]|nr:DNA-packaging protein [Hyphomicrobiales bacterium]MBI3672370.1 DNA-packaging protein [Hyphomicrobiales bacterium]